MHRFLNTFTDRKVAILANDPTISTNRAATAFLADRVRMNNIYDERVWLRSIATGSAYAPLSPSLPRLVDAFRNSGYDLIVVETPGTGQAGLDLDPLQPDLVVYVETCEYGSSLQLQKDQMLHSADLVVLNKADLQGAEAAFAEIRTALIREGNRSTPFPATAKTARDPGIDRIFAEICSRLHWPVSAAQEIGDIFQYAKKSSLVPHHRRAYLSEIASKVRDYDRWTAGQLQKIRENPDDLSLLDPLCIQLLEQWPNQWRELALKAGAKAEQDPDAETLNGLKLPRVALTRSG